MARKIAIDAEVNLHGGMLHTLHITIDKLHGEYYVIGNDDIHEHKTAD